MGVNQTISEKKGESVVIKTCSQYLKAQRHYHFIFFSWTRM